eukprot:6527172-Ditylum_brightwellii.AAC.1
MNELETDHQQENKQEGFATQEEGTVMENNQEKLEEPEYDNDWEDAFKAKGKRREAEHTAAKTNHVQMIADNKNMPNKQQKRIKWSAQFDDSDEKKPSPPIKGLKQDVSKSAIPNTNIKSTNRPNKVVGTTGTSHKQ